jgi:G3E family GTPase
LSLPVTIISGYLGAGKTTLVNSLLRQADGRRLAVMVNEFGDLPIDAELIEAEGDDLIALAGGCVCCSYGDDLMAALSRMAEMQPAPDHVILEASGVALPGSISASLTLVQGISPSGIVVLADVEQLERQLSDEYIGDTVIRQLQAADLVILTKGDVAGAEAVSQAGGLALEKASDVHVIEAALGAIPLDTVLRKDQRPKNTAQEPHGNAAGLTRRIEACEGITDARRYAARLAASPQIIRAKGHVKGEEGMQTIQVVGDRWEVSSAPCGANGGVVIIEKAKL